MYAHVFLHQGSYAALISFSDSLLFGGPGSCMSVFDIANVACLSSLIIIPHATSWIQEVAMFHTSRPDFMIIFQITYSAWAWCAVVPATARLNNCWVALPCLNI